MEKIPCRYFFQKKVRNASEKHLNGDLHFKWRKFSVEIFFKKGSKRFWKRMNGEISIQNGDLSILNGEEWIICVFFVYFRSARPKKKLKNHLHSKKNKRFSTTFEVKNASFFEKTDAKRFSKKKWMEISPFWMEVSPFKFFRSVFNFFFENSL